MLNSNKADFQVAHLDLKPQNILLTGSKQEPKIKVADFGFAKILKSSTSSADASLRGSLLYMAPEIILTPSKYDETLADMWSVGIIIFGKTWHTLNTQADGITLF